MKLLMIAPKELPCPPVSGGAVEYTMLQIANRLKKNHNVTIISRTYPGYPRVTKRGKFSILRVPTGSAYLSNALNRARKQRFDWIQVDNRPTYIPQIRRRFPRAKIALFLHSTTFVLSAKQRISRLFQQADVIVGNSVSLKRQLSTLAPTHRSKIRYVHLGVDLSQFKPPTAAQRARIRSKYGVQEGYNIVFAGRLRSTKGVHILVKAVSLLKNRIPNLRLIIAGGSKNTAYKKHLQALARSYGIRCKFLGKIPRHRMHEVYWMTDCFVCPSQRHEAFGLVVVEALACGVPVIASRNGGITEILRHKQNGLLVRNYRNPQGFSNAILSVYRNRKWAKNLSVRGRMTVVRKFSWSTTASRLAAIYRK